MPTTMRDYGFSRFLQLLFARRFPVWLRYGTTLAVVAFFVAVRLSVPLSGLGFDLFIPAVLISSLAFGRGPGFLATVLTAVAAIYFVVDPRRTFYVPRSEILPVAIYLVIGAGISLLCHTLRATMHRAIAAERAKTVLLDELAHRTKNNLQMVASLLSLQARGLSEAAGKTALETAAARVLAVAKLHNRLQSNGSDGAVDMREYLNDLCQDLRNTYGELRPVAVQVKADHAILGTAVAAPIGLIVNELVTNAFKYAFPDNGSGIVEVSFRRTGEKGYELRVSDDGVGSTDAKEGLGSRLIRLLVQQLDGTLHNDHPARGTMTAVALPGLE